MGNPFPNFSDMQTLQESTAQSIFDTDQFFSTFASERSWEPGWLADHRSDAWEKFRKFKESPLKDENWRFSPKHLFSLANIQNLSSGKDLVQLGAIESDQALFQNLDKMILDFPNELSTITEQKGPDLGATQTYCLTSALADNGFFLGTRKNAEIKDPFVIEHKIPKDESITFEKNVIHVAPFSSAVVFEFINSVDSTSRGNASSTLNVTLGESAKLVRVLVQNANTNTTLHQFENFSLGRDSTLRNVTIHIGASHCRSETKGDLVGRGASFENFSLFMGSGNQLFDQRTRQVHSSPDCTSILLSKNALNDQAKSIFSGLIKVEEVASNTNAYQTNRNLLLCNDAEADSLPGLEILANEVKCSHGATTSKIDEQELFYLLSRGIPLRSAEKLISLGFLDEVIEKANNEDLIEKVRAIIESKFDS